MMKFSILFSGLLFLSVYGISQTIECGTETTKEELSLLREFKNSTTLKSSTSTSITYFAVRHHIVRTSLATGGLGANWPAIIIEEMNDAYSDANIQFYSCESIDYIDSDTYYDFNYSDESTLRTAHNNANTINIYYFNSVTKNSSSLCGYAYYPSSSINFIAMANNCATNGSTMIHEMGHFFGLPHTHNSSDDELVDGSNCSTAGDNFCDTPADPNLYEDKDGDGYSEYVVDNNCVYIGTETDNNGDSYSPSTVNLMSYSRKHCRDEFSNEQLTEVNAWATSSSKLQSFVHTTLIDNETITSDRTVTDDVIIIDDVSIENNSDVIIDACESVTIEKDFEVKVGSTLEIK